MKTILALLLTFALVGCIKIDADDLIPDIKADDYISGVTFAPHTGTSGTQTLKVTFNLGGTGNISEIKLYRRTGSGDTLVGTESFPSTGSITMYNPNHTYPFGASTYYFKLVSDLGKTSDTKLYTTN